MAAENPPYVLQAGSHGAELFRRALKALAPFAGVVGAGDLAVSANGTPNMSVNVAAGEAVIHGSENTAQGSYYVRNDATANLSVAASDPTNPRNDLVVAKVQDAAYSGATNAWSVAVVTGTPAASPVDPATPANAIVLARVRVDAAVTSIVAGKITDLRDRATARGGIVVAPSTDLPTMAEGMGLYEKDTDLLKFHDGTALKTVDQFGRGLALIAEATLTADAAIIDFQDIPQTYSHLQVYVAAQGSTASDVREIRFRLNNDSGPAYFSQVQFAQNGSNQAQVAAGGQGLLGWMPGGNTASRLGSAVLWLPNYADSSKQQHVHCVSGAVGGAAPAWIVGNSTSLWTGTAAINRLTLLPQTDNFVAGTKVSLYGVR